MHQIILNTVSEAWDCFFTPGEGVHGDRYTASRYVGLTPDDEDYGKVSISFGTPLVESYYAILSNSYNSISYKTDFYVEGLWEFMDHWNPWNEEDLSRPLVICPADSQRIDKDNPFYKIIDNIIHKYPTVKDLTTGVFISHTMPQDGDAFYTLTDTSTNKSVKIHLSNGFNFYDTIGQIFVAIDAVQSYYGDIEEIQDFLKSTNYK